MEAWSRAGYSSAERAGGGIGLPDGPRRSASAPRTRRFAPGRKGRDVAPIYTLELLGDATMITCAPAGRSSRLKAHKDYRAEIGDRGGVSPRAGALPPLRRERAARVSRRRGAAGGVRRRLRQPLAEARSAKTDERHETFAGKQKNNGERRIIAFEDQPSRASPPRSSLAAAPPSRRASAASPRTWR